MIFSRFSFSMPEALRQRPLKERAAAGVTLIEMLIVVAVIGILAALVFPSVQSSLGASQRTACLARMKQLAAVLSQYSADNNNRVMPVLTGASVGMNDNAWYEILDGSGYLPGSPHGASEAGEGWGGRRNSIMSCPSRDNPAYPYWMGGSHALHYSLNQHPGFLNRVNTASGSWPTLAQIRQPSRTFLIAEASSFLGRPDGEFWVYPHPRKGKSPDEGNGMNLIFFDGHAEFFKGRLPVLPGSDFASINYDAIPPESSFPWF